MAKIIILGSAGGVPDVMHEGTHLAVVGKKKTVLVDCSGNPMARLEQAGVPLDSIEDLILTHYHPDHTYGVPMLLMGMWLLKRQVPLSVYGLRRTLARVKKTMDLYDWKSWKNFYPISFHEVPSRSMTPLFEDSEMKVLAAPVKHVIPTIGLRFEFPGENRVAAYTADTQPCPAVNRLARGADVLIHEAMGEGKGHTSPRQAGEDAARAGAGCLYLIHYPVKADEDELIRQAGETCRCPVLLAKDFMTIEF